MSWKSEARNALRLYPKVKRRQSETADMKITPAYGGTAVSHSASRTTENVALRSTLTPHEENVISAVAFMMRMQSAYPNGQERMRMIKLVYFQRTHTLEGAAMECNYSDRTIKRWNMEILTAVYVEMKK